MLLSLQFIINGRTPLCPRRSTTVEYSAMIISDGCKPGYLSAGYLLPINKK